MALLALLVLLALLALQALLALPALLALLAATDAVGAAGASGLVARRSSSLSFRKKKGWPAGNAISIRKLASKQNGRARRTNRTESSRHDASVLIQARKN